MARKRARIEGWDVARRAENGEPVWELTNPAGRGRCVMRFQAGTTDERMMELRAARLVAEAQAEAAYRADEDPLPFARRMGELDWVLKHPEPRKRGPAGSGAKGAT